MERARARPALAAGIVLAAIVVASALLRIFLSRNAPGPWIFVDELIYSELGRSAFSGTEIRGMPVTGYGNIYPFIIAPAYEVFSDLVSAYSAVKVINAVVMSLTAIPAYFIARTLMQRSWSLVAAALTVLVPSMAYTGMVMTESAFYPAFALAMLLVIRALQRPTIFSQLLAFAGQFHGRHGKASHCRPLLSNGVGHKRIICHAVTVLTGILGTADDFSLGVCHNEHIHLPSLKSSLQRVS